MDELVQTVSSEQEAAVSQERKVRTSVLFERVCCATIHHCSKRINIQHVTRGENSFSDKTSVRSSSLSPVTAAEFRKLLDFHGS